MDPRAAEEFYLRTFAEPALDVNGFESGSPHLQKTVLPVEAVANLSIRLAPGQQVERDRPERRAAAARGGARRAPSSRSSAGRRRRPGSSRPTRRRSSSGSTPSSASLGVRPALIRIGRHAADRPGARRQGHPDDHHRLRPARLEHPLAERAAARRVRAARDRGRARAVPRARGALSSSSGARSCAATRLRSPRVRLAGSSSARRGRRAARGRRRAAAGDRPRACASAVAARVQQRIDERRSGRRPSAADGVDDAGRACRVPEQEDRARVVGERSGRATAPSIDVQRLASSPLARRASEIVAAGCGRGDGADERVRAGRLAGPVARGRPTVGAGVLSICWSDEPPRGAERCHDTRRPLRDRRRRRPTCGTPCEQNEDLGAASRRRELRSWLGVRSGAERWPVAGLDPGARATVRSARREQLAVKLKTCTCASRPPRRRRSRRRPLRRWRLRSRRVIDPWRE